MFAVPSAETRSAPVTAASSKAGIRGLAVGYELLDAGIERPELLNDVASHGLRRGGLVRRGLTYGFLSNLGGPSRQNW